MENDLLNIDKSLYILYDYKVNCSGSIDQLPSSFRIAIFRAVSSLGLLSFIWDYRGLLYSCA